MTASVGIAVFPNDSDDDDALLRHAGIAMNGARRRGPGHYAFFDEAMHAGAQTRIKLEALLQTALEKDEFSLHYQPQFDLSTGKISGMEALLRWNSAELGSMPPGPVHPGRRGDRRHPAGRRMGVAHGVPAGADLAAERTARHAHRASTFVSAVHAAQFRDARGQVLEETGLAPHSSSSRSPSRC